MCFVQFVLTFSFAAYKINDGLVYRMAQLGTVLARCYFFYAKTGVLSSIISPCASE